MDWTREQWEAHMGEHGWDAFLAVDDPDPVASLSLMHDGLHKQAGFGTPDHDHGK